MTKKRKQTRRASGPGRPVLQNLRTIGAKIDQPLLAIDLEPNQPTRRNQPSTSADVKRLLCFSRIPACCLSSRGIGASESIADESAAHAMLDFFRLAISPEFVQKLVACADDDAVEALMPQVAVVFEEFKNAIDADYLLIKRCSQFEVSSATSIRGKEVKKRVLLNIKTPGIGYTSGVNRNIQQQNTSEVITVKDEDEQEKEDEEVQEESAPSSPASDSSDIIIIEEVKKTPTQTPPKAPVKNPSATPKAAPRVRLATPKKSPSPQLQRVRDLDESERHRLIQERNQLAQYQDNGRPKNYFGEYNKSNAGPPEVFCSLPTVKPTVQYEEAQYSDDDEDSDDEGAKEVPKKRARLDDDDDDVFVLNMTTTGASSEASGDAGVYGNQVKSPEKRAKDSDDEIGEIIDEWNEEQGEEDTSDRKDEEEVTTTTTPNGTNNGFYDGHSTHQRFVEARGLPINYQARTIGVVLNEKLCRSVERHVEKTTEACFDSVENLARLSWVHYRSNIQDDEIYKTKNLAREVLQREIQKLLPEKTIKLLITGSTINGCGSFNSDMDMCLCYPTNAREGRTFEDFTCDRAHSTKILRKVDKAARRCKIGQAVRSVIAKCSVIPAKVPIIKCLLTRSYGGVDVDINVNNIAGIYNSHLTHYYSLVDARFPALALIVKHWACTSGIGNAPDGYLNSYSLILMVIHYLQCGVTPAVLPNLQYLFPDLFDRKIPITELHLFGDISSKLPPSVPNTWSLGELLIGFFYYYANFDFQKNAISIRSAQVVPRNCLPRDTVIYPLFIEEPFDAINTARSVRTTGHMRTIKSEIRAVSDVLSPRKARFDLADFGVKVIDHI